MAEAGQVAGGIDTLPNRLTTLRLILSFVLFAAIHFGWWAASITLFAVASFSDWLDGFIARKWNLGTALGRAYDPLIDKILISGTFVFLVEIADRSGVRAWMVTMILAREFLVTGLRGYLEQRNVEFGADLFGKGKTVLQMVAILWILLVLLLSEQNHAADWMRVVRDGLLYLVVGLTVFSGANYLRKAYPHLV